jgi:hypothetical protein
VLTPIPISADKCTASLVDFALELINEDRRVYNLTNVTLSSIKCAQQHAVDMLNNHYFSHWNTYGFKPYMRYTLAGGKGSVVENIAWQSGNTVNDLNGVKDALKKLEWQMMNNDASSNWGHRENILEPEHNKVSIGIACDAYNVYFVEDFEQDYVNFSQFQVNQGNVTLEVYLPKKEVQIRTIGVFFDKLKNLTSQELCSPPFNGLYDPGKIVAQVLPENYHACGTKSIIAPDWTQSNDVFKVSFSLQDITTIYGKGVYTIYLLSQSSIKNALANISIWV